MGFSENERRELLKLKNVTKFVIDRLEECGFTSLSEDSAVEPQVLLERLSRTIDDSLWNSADRKKAVEQVMKLARLKTVATQ